MFDLGSTTGSGVQKPICTICFDDLKPIAEDLQTFPICGHVFHELCIQQWLEYCPSEKKPTCPVCKQRCPRQNITRLYFQSTGDSTQTSSSFPLQGADAYAGALEMARTLKEKLTALRTTFENQQVHLKNVEEELYTCKQLVKREEMRNNELKKEKESYEQLLYNKTEELSIKTAEFSKVQERSLALAKELASLKLATDLNLEEEDMAKLVSISQGNNTENAVEMLTKSLARRNKSYKELMIQCSINGRSKTRACKELDMAKEKINKLKTRLQEVEKALEEKENEVLRDLKASCKLKPKPINLSNITMEDLALRQCAMENTYHITNNCLEQICRAESSKHQILSSPVLDESNLAVDLSVDTLNRLDVNGLKLISDSNGRPTPVDEHVNGQADGDALLMPRIQSSSIQNAEGYAYTSANIACCKFGNESKEIGEIAPVFIEGNVTHVMNENITEKLLTSATQKDVPYLATMRATQVCQSPASLVSNRIMGRWCRQNQHRSSNSGDLIAVGADGRGGRIKMPTSKERIFVCSKRGSKRLKPEATLASQLNIENFFLEKARSLTREKR